MCGIVGVVTARQAERDAAVERACEAMTHRGPDGHATFSGDEVALGHTRLAIIDRLARSDQPMHDPDTGNVMVFNGEIYNYQELAAELVAKGHVRRTSGDSEVLLLAYREWGERCVDHLNGMFAFAIWDPLRGALFVGRDRLGEKPFHLCRRRGEVWFASEIKALIAAGALQPRVREDELYRYLTRADLGHPERTMFEGVTQLPAGHAGWLHRDGRLRLTRYWAPPLERATDPVDADEIAALWQDSVRLRLRSDVPVGTSLSSGLDSSTVLATVRALEPTAEMHSFTASFPGTDVDELPRARELAERLGVVVHPVALGADDLPRDIDQVVWANESPVEAPSVLAQHRVMEAAREAGVVVLLDGQGGDEVFAGYDKYVGAHLLDLGARGRVSAATELWRRWASTHERRMHLPFSRVAALRTGSTGRRQLARVGSRMSDGWLAPGYRRTYEASDPVEGDTLPRIKAGEWSEAMRAQDLGRVTLPRLLRYGDRMSMASSREVRLPYLDHRLIELGATIPPAQSFERGATKAPLRHVLDDLGFPDVAWRQDKKNFMPPETQWFAEPANRDLIADAWRAGHRAGVLAGPDPVDGIRPRWRVLSAWRWLEAYGLSW